MNRFVITQFRLIYCLLSGLVLVFRTVMRGIFHRLFISESKDTKHIFSDVAKRPSGFSAKSACKTPVNNNFYPSAQSALSSLHTPHLVPSHRTRLSRSRVNRTAGIFFFSVTFLTRLSRSRVNRTANFFERSLCVCI